MRSRIVSASYFRTFIFGVEDSLVSTVGLLSGIAVADVPGEIIFLTGAVLILVEAFSMAAGAFLSEHSAEDYLHQKGPISRRSFIAGAIMFFSYFISGLIPLFPYVVWPAETAMAASIAGSLGALLLLGVASARISGTSLWRNSARVLVIGGIAVAVGVAAGQLIRFSL